MSRFMSCGINILRLKQVSITLAKFKGSGALTELVGDDRVAQCLFSLIVGQVAKRDISVRS